MSALKDITPEQFADPLDLFGATSAARQRRIGEEASAASIAETQRQFDIGQEILEPFVAESVPAFQRQAALAGSRGPAEQGLAFQQFRESPATQFLRESGLSLGGQNLTGAPQQELERFAQGLALQDFSNQFNRLGTVAGSGQAAASNLVGLGEETARQTIQQREAELSAIRSGIAGQQAARANLLGTGLGVASFALGGSNQPTTQSRNQIGVPINQTNVGGFV